MRIAGTIAILLIALLLCSCPPKGGGKTGQAMPRPSSGGGGAVTIWYEPLVETALDAFADAVKEQHGLDLKLLPAERGEVRASLTDSAGDKPDIYIIADNELFMEMVAATAVDEASARIFAGDRLAVVQQSGEKYESPTLFDIYKLRFKQLGLGAPETAIGYFSEQALLSDGARERISDRLKVYPRTTDILGGLGGDEVQVAILTSSLVVTQEQLALVLLIREDLHEDIQYRAVAAAGRGGDARVLQVLRLLAEDEAMQKLLIGYGLVDRESALIENK